MKIDTSCDGRVDWNEFCSYMMLEYEKNQPQEHGLKIDEHKPTRMQAHRESIVHMSFAPPKSWLDASRARQLITFDSGGCVCKWNSDFTAPNQKVDLELPASRPQVIAVQILPNLNRCVVSLMNRSLRFFELSCISGMVCEIVGLEHSILSMDAQIDELDQSLTLLLGDLGGFVSHLTFTDPKTSLFGGTTIEIRYRDVLAGVYAPDATLVKRKVHSDWATKVMCCNSRGMYVSCCSADRASLILGDKAGIISTFNVTKGIRVFDVNSNFNSIVTGGQDYLVRVWDKYITSRPCAVLDGHAAPVCSVALAVPSTEQPHFETAASPHDLDGHQARVISVSIDQVLKVWDVTTQGCLQTLTMHGFSTRKIEQGYHLLLSAERGTLFIGSSTVLAYRLHHQKPPQVSESLSHSCPVSGAKFNPLFGQVVTVCRGSVVNVWNLKTGEQMVQFRDAHGDAEITTLTFDQSSRRLLTGASDGSVKVWNFNIGLCLRKLRSVASTEVSGIVEMKNQAMVTAGWWRTLSYYRDQEDHYYVQPDRSIQGIGHAEDIQCLEHCGGNNVATCSYDGVIIIWQIEMLSIKRKITIETRREHPEAPSATEKLLFLEQRSRSRGGSLVAGGAGGWIRFWNIYSGSLVGAFQIVSDVSAEEAALNKSRSASALATSREFGILVTGDSCGEVKIWNISNYCCKQAPRRVGSPPLVSSWIAHAGAIVTLQIIDQPRELVKCPKQQGSAASPERLGCATVLSSPKESDPTTAAGNGASTLRMILSASADKTVRLWTIDGTLIGTFGQHEPWDISNPDLYTTSKTGTA